MGVPSCLRSELQSFAKESRAKTAKISKGRVLVNGGRDKRPGVGTGRI